MRFCALRAKENIRSLEPVGYAKPTVVQRASASGRALLHKCSWKFEGKKWTGEKKFCLSSLPLVTSLHEIQQIRYARSQASRRQLLCALGGFIILGWPLARRKFCLPSFTSCRVKFRRKSAQKNMNINWILVRGFNTRLKSALLGHYSYILM